MPDYYQHLIDQDVSERELENKIGEGWSTYEIYVDKVENGLVEPI